MAVKKDEKNDAISVYGKVSDVAKLLDITPQWVRDLARKGVFVTHKVAGSNRYFLPDVIRAYVHYLRDQINNKSKPDDVALAEREKALAEASIKKSKAAIAQMEQDELEGKLHRAEDVKAITTDHVLFLRSMLMAMPGKLAVDLAGDHTASEQAEVVQNEVNFVLNSLADYRYDPKEYKKRVKERRGWEDLEKDDADA